MKVKKEKARGILRKRSSWGSAHPEGGTMLRYALIFFIVALIAAAFGFLGIATAAVGVAKILFFVFLVLFLLSLVGGLVRQT